MKTIPNAQTIAISNR